jgi:hypothetical protein
MQKNVVIGSNICYYKKSKIIDCFIESFTVISLLCTQ